MKYYEKMIEMGCFSRSELTYVIGCDATAASIIQAYLKKGYIERVRHDLYAVISLETKQPILSRYQIGGHIFPDACISHHSAFEYYGYANQVFYEVYVTTKSRFKDFTYNGISYHRIAPRIDGYMVQADDLRITSVERTVVDSIHDLERVGGLEETLRCLLLVPSLDWKMLLDILEQYHSGFLYQKCGYILEQFNTSITLPQAFFIECRKHISNSKRYLVKGQTGAVWHDKWKLYAPDSIHNLTNKGVTDYDAV